MLACEYTVYLYIVSSIHSTVLMLFTKQLSNGFELCFITKLNLILSFKMFTNHLCRPQRRHRSFKESLLSNAAIDGEKEKHLQSSNSWNFPKELFTIPHIKLLIYSWHLGKARYIMQISSWPRAWMELVLCSRGIWPWVNDGCWGWVQAYDPVNFSCGSW